MADLKNLAKDRSRSDGATSAKPLNINTSFKKKQQENRTTVPVNSLVEYRGEQPFDDYKDTEQFDALMESISTEGLANPITVREIGDGKYEIVSGHHRSEVFRRLGKTDIPAVVYPKDTPEDMIVAAMINGNTLNGRASLKVSEKCKALLLYSKVLERRQGLRTDMFSNDDFDDEIESDKNYDIYEQLRIKFNEGHRSTVVRLLKAAKDMPPDILDKVDNKEIGFMVAYKVMQQSDKKFRDELYSHIREGKKLTESSLNTLIDAYNTRKEAKILEEQMKKEAEQERLENQRHKEELAKKSVEQDNSDDDIDTVNQEGVHSASTITTYQPVQADSASSQETPQPIIIEPEVEIARTEFSDIIASSKAPKKLVFQRDLSTLPKFIREMPPKEQESLINDLLNNYIKSQGII